MLRVMTLNVWNLAGPWSDRRVEIATWLARLAPDVVCLQEIVDDGAGKNQAAWLATSDALAPLAYTHVYAPGLEVGDGSFGNAVLTRRPVETTDTVRLPALDAPDEGRVLLHVRTGGIDVFCTHLNWQFDHGYIREAQATSIVDAIGELADPASHLPPILAGDFNAEPQSTEIRFLTGDASLGGRSTYFQDAWRVAGGDGPGWTWDNRNPFAAKEHEPDRRLDYVFAGWKRASGAGRIESARVVCDRALTGTFATDHFGVLAEIAD